MLKLLFVCEIEIFLEKMHHSRFCPRDIRNNFYIHTFAFDICFSSRSHSLSPNATKFTNRTVAIFEEGMRLVSRRVRITERNKMKEEKKDGNS